MSDCPNPKGMAVEFGEDVVRARAWRLKGVGPYGTDVDVIDIEAYRELAHLQATTMETLTRWAESTKNAEDRLVRAIGIGEDMCEALRGEANPACDRWDDLMADEFVKAIGDASS